MKKLIDKLTGKDSQAPNQEPGQESERPSPPPPPSGVAEKAQSMEKELLEGSTPADITQIREVLSEAGYTKIDTLTVSDDCVSAICYPAPAAHNNDDFEAVIALRAAGLWSENSQLLGSGVLVRNIRKLSERTPSE